MDVRPTGDEVLEALSYCNSSTKFERRLNSEGETLANLIAARVLTILRARLAGLAAPLSDEDI